MKTHRFAIAARDELWALGTLVESRLSHGEALTSAQQIDARDKPDDELVALCEAAIESLRTNIEDADVRLVATARRVDDHAPVVASTMVITRNGVSLVTNTLADVSMFAFAAPQPGIAATRQPILWKNGSGAVLLHEAIGHAAEHGAPPIEWPSWLRVTDEPDFAIDDVGEPARVADLLREPPQSFRRESFRDVPLRRMTRVVVRQESAPFALPDEHIEVLLVAGGQYEPLTDEVSLFIARARSGGVELAPFALHATRSEIARALLGASGEPERYPGVICSREGQEVVVGSHAPLLLTAFG